VVIDQAAVLELIDQLRAAVPPEVSQARRITEEATRITERAQEEGDAVIARAQEQAARRAIPHSFVFIRTNALIATREEKRLAASIGANGLPLTKVRLNERTAFSAMFEAKVALDELDPEWINGLEEARVNAAAFTAEVVAMLRNAERKAA